MAAEPRTNLSFRDRSDFEFHNGESILETLAVDMVLDFPIDPMHQIFIGVTKKWVELNFIEASCKMSPTAITSLNNSIKD